MYGSIGTLTYFDESVKTLSGNSRNVKLAEFLSRDPDNRAALKDTADGASGRGRQGSEAEHATNKKEPDQKDSGTQKFMPTKSLPVLSSSV